MQSGYIRKVVQAEGSKVLGIADQLPQERFEFADFLD